MRVLISYLTALLRKHDIHNLNSIATSVYCGDYTVPEAVQIYRLNVKDVEYIAMQSTSTTSMKITFKNVREVTYNETVPG